MSHTDEGYHVTSVTVVRKGQLLEFCLDQGQPTQLSILLFCFCCVYVYATALEIRVSRHHFVNANLDKLFSFQASLCLHWHFSSLCFCCCFKQYMGLGSYYSCAATSKKMSYQMCHSRDSVCTLLHEQFFLIYFLLLKNNSVVPMSLIMILIPLKREMFALLFLLNFSSVKCQHSF